MWTNRILEELEKYNYFISASKITRNWKTRFYTLIRKWDKGKNKRCLEFENTMDRNDYLMRLLYSLRNNRNELEIVYEYRLEKYKDLLYLK